MVFRHVSRLRDVIVDGTCSARLGGGDESACFQLDLNRRAPQECMHARQNLPSTSTYTQ